MGTAVRLAPGIEHAAYLAEGLLSMHKGQFDPQPCFLRGACLRTQTFRRRRQEDQRFKVILDYVLSSRLAWATSQEEANKQNQKRVLTRLRQRLRALRCL